MIAFMLTVLSADPSSKRYTFRYYLSMFVVLPVMVLHTVLYLSGQFLPYQYQPSHFVSAVTEYIVMLLVVLWPISWVSEVRSTWQLNGNGHFAWPKTAWRFV